jgi:DNA-binding winged helix-turn-helix (wHTH) protein/TolB-like protein/Tfp pilus assembly protein PilF
MTNEHSSLRAFGNCRLDTQKKLLWADDKPVDLPLKAIELLCVLVEGRGSLLTKDQIWHDVWNDAFVEETNLTHNIYLLRKTLKDLGQANLIETVPRRGYRFCGEVFELPDEEIVLKRHALTRTTVEFQDADDSVIAVPRISGTDAKRIDRRVVLLVACIALAAVLGGAVIWRRQVQPARAESAAIRSIAVLPLRSLNDTEDDKLLSRGIADALMTSLGSVNKGRVISTDHAGSETGPQKEPSEVGREVSVDSVLDGTFQKSGGKLRVTLRLIRTIDGAQIWSRSFDESEGDIFKLQDAIAAETARSLKWDLSPDEQHKIAKRYTDNREAYEAYLRGRFLFDKRTSESYEMAIGQFERAIELDPNYALALSGLADVYAMQANAADSSDERGELYERSISTAVKALQLDEALAEAHTTLGWIKRTHEWDWAGSEAEFKRAIELNPNYANAHQWYALLLTTLGRGDEASREAQIAHDLEPLSLIVLQNYFSVAAYFRRDFAKADDVAEQIRSLQQDQKASARSLTYIFGKAGDHNKALEAGEAYLAKYGEPPNYIKVPLAIAYARTGQDAKAAEMISSLELRSDNNSEAVYRLAQVHGELGHKEEAIAMLQKCLAAHDDRMVWVKVESNFDSLRDDPRFNQILIQMNLAG